MRTGLRGYRRGEVDTFLDRCAATLGARAAELPELQGRGALARGPRVTPEEVAQVRFRMEFGGYALDVVDDLLDRVEAALRADGESAPTP